MKSWGVIAARFHFSLFTSSSSICCKDKREEGGRRGREGRKARLAPVVHADPATHARPWGALPRGSPRPGSALAARRSPVDAPHSAAARGRPSRASPRRLRAGQPRRGAGGAGVRCGSAAPRRREACAGGRMRPCPAPSGGFPISAFGGGAVSFLVFLDFFFFFGLEGFIAFYLDHLYKSYTFG